MKYHLYSKNNHIVICGNIDSDMQLIHRNRVYLASGCYLPGSWGDRKAKARYWTAYALCFAVMFTCMSIACIKENRGFIWSVDGIEQQYTFFLLEGQWIRDLLNNFFVLHTFDIPMWSDQIGYGADYFLSLGAVIGNPINLISVFATPQNADWILNATVPITLFFAGVMFSFYGKHKDASPFAVLLGCMVYVFSGYSLVAFTQIFMIYVLILAPMVLLGVDLVFEHRSPSLFVIAMSLCFIASINTGYAVCLLLLIYCIIRFAFLDEKRTIVGFARWFGKIFGLILVGALVSSVLLIPSTLSILGMDRLGLERPLDLFYSLSYYLQFYSGILAGSYVGADCFVGFAPIGLVALAVVFSRCRSSKINSALCILFVILTICACVPFIGKVFNGFAYPNNRWIWAYSLLVGCATMFAVEQIPTMSKRQRNVAFAILATYGAVSLVFLQTRFSSSFYLELAIVFATISLVFLTNGIGKAWRRGATLSVLLACFVMYVQWGIVGRNVEGNVALGESYSYMVRDNPASLVLSVDDMNEGWRFDMAECQVWRNGNIPLGVNGTTFYNSVYNNYIDDYHKELGLVTSTMNFSYAGLDSRQPMEAMAGTKYFIVPKGSYRMLPALYDHLISTGIRKDVEYEMYGTDSLLPLAFLYDSAIDRKEYESLSPIERQEAMFEGVVLENPSMSTRSFERELSHDVEFYFSSLDSSIADNGSSYSVDNASSIAQDSFEKSEGSSIVVTEPNTVLHLEADIPDGASVYVTFEGLNYSSDIASAAYFNDSKVQMEMDDFVSNDLSSDAKTECKIFISNDGYEQEIWHALPSHHLYGGKDDWCMYAGEYDSSSEGLSLRFQDAGVYSFDSVTVSIENTEGYSKLINDLASSSASEISQCGNSISCAIDVQEDEGFLYFRVPYSAGWSAVVDGEPVEIQRANTGFMGVYVDQGSHEVELKYETPYLKIGLIVTVLGLLLAVTLIILWHKWDFRQRMINDHNYKGGR